MKVPMSLQYESNADAAAAEAAKAYRGDGWVNTLTGIGGRFDKTIGAYPCAELIDFNTLIQLFTDDDIAGKIVLQPVEDATRQGYTFDGADLNDDEKTTEARFRIDASIFEAWTYARLMGALLYLGTNSDPRLPMGDSEELQFLTVVDRRNANIAQVSNDPLSPNFDRPTHYRLGTVDVHVSRLIIFPGAFTEREMKRRNSGWDMSVLQRPYGILRSFGQAFQGAGILMSEAVQSVFALTGLVQMIASGQQEALQNRMAIVDMARSVGRAVLIDKDRETFTRDSVNLSGVSDMLDRFMQRMAGASGIPVTVLFGMSPAGMNATGASDIRLYYDTVRKLQEQVYVPALEKIWRMLGKKAKIECPSLWQPTQEEELSARKTQSEIDKAYIEAMVVHPDEIAKSRFTDSGFSFDTEIEKTAPVEPTEDAPAALPNSAAESAESLVTPTDLAGIVQVNQALASVGLPPWPDAIEGKMTVEQFRELKRAQGAAVGEAKGGEQAEELAPNAPEPAPPVAPGAPVPDADAKLPVAEDEDDDAEPSSTPFPSA